MPLDNTGHNMHALDISTRAMLVCLTITQWTAHKVDKEVTETVHRDYQAKTDAGRYNKRLIAKDSIAEMRRIAGEARNTHYAMTLPWANDGARILSAALFDKYDATMRRLRDEFEFTVAAFIAEYPALVKDARRRLGGLFKAGDYPDAHIVAQRFTWDLRFLPMPKGDDFRVNMSAAMAEHIRADIEKRTRATLEEAARDVWHRVVKVVEHMAGSLEDYAVHHVDGKAKVEHPFRDTLVTNVRELADLLPGLNITGDPALAKVASDITAKLTRRDAQELRDDKKVRKAVAKDARAILADMKAAMG